MCQENVNTILKGLKTLVFLLFCKKNMFLPKEKKILDETGLQTKAPLPPRRNPTNIWLLSLAGGGVKVTDVTE